MEDEAKSFVNSLRHNPKWQVARVASAQKGRGVHYTSTDKTNTILHLLYTGMGKDKAQQACEVVLTEEKLRFVLTCGFAGALAPNLKPGDILAQLNEFFPTNIIPNSLPQCTFHCSDKVIRTAQEKTNLFQQTNSLAVEMESGIIQQYCTAHRIPCATIRVISDTAQEELPIDFEALSGKDGKVSISQLMGELIRHPGKIPSLVRLGFHCNYAAKKLATCLREILERT